MQNEREDGWSHEDSRRTTRRWNLWGERPYCHQGVCAAAQSGADQSLLTNPQRVTCAYPIVSLWFGLKRGLELLKPFSKLRKIELPSAFQQNLLPALRTMHCFPRLEDVTLRSVDITSPRWPEMFASDEDAARPFCDFSKLRRLVLSDVKVDDLFFAWLAEATNLEILELKDMTYEGSLESLRNLVSLRRLELTGHFESIASVFSFVSCFPRLKDLTVEMSAPDEEDLKLLSKCHADVHLKVRRCYHPGQISALCEIDNLKSLTLSSPFGFKIPKGFKALTKLSSLGFIDKGHAFNEMEGFENVPTSISSLSLDLKFPSESRLLRILSILDQFDSLVSLELRVDEELHSEVLVKIAGIIGLKHLTIGGCFNVEDGLSSLVRSLDLISLSIENGLITSEVINMLAELTHLTDLTFSSCYFLTSNFCDSFTSLWSLVSLTIDYPSGGHQLIAGLARNPIFTALHLFRLRISSGDLSTEDARCNDVVVTRRRNCREI